MKVCVERENRWTDSSEGCKKLKYSTFLVDDAEILHRRAQDSKQSPQACAPILANLVLASDLEVKVLPGQRALKCT